MKAKVYAFVLEVKGGLSVDNFTQHLIGLNGRQNDNRILACGNTGPYLGGLLLTIKDMKTFCKLMRQQGKSVVKPETLANGERLVEFNYFLINRSSGKGLYQHYHQSTAVTVFCEYMRQLFNKYYEQCQQDFCRNKGWLIDSRNLAKARKAIKSTLEHSVILRQDSLNEFIDEMSHIRSIALRPKSIDYTEATYIPNEARNALRDVERKFVFHKGPQFLNAAKETALTLFGDKKDLKKGVVVGLDLNGDEVSFKLDNDYQSLVEADRDELAAYVDLSQLDTSIVDNTGLQWMLDIADRHSSYL